MSSAVYLASEDSTLLRNALRGYSGDAALEIGAGNGVNLVHLADAFRKVIGTDLVSPSMSDWWERGAEMVLTDGASCFRDGTFDLVAFNPPYVPSGEVVDPAVDDGGNAKVPLMFLREALRVVKDEGKIVMVVGGEDRLKDFAALCALKGFSLNLVAKKHLFYEELSVYEASTCEKASD